MHLKLEAAATTSPFLLGLILAKNILGPRYILAALSLISPFVIHSTLAQEVFWCVLNLPPEYSNEAYSQRVCSNGTYMGGQGVMENEKQKGMNFPESGT